MVETSHKSRSPGRLLNWAWPTKKRRESHPPPSISISDTSGRLERAATLQGEPLLHGTPPRRQSDASFSVGDPSSTTSSMSGSRRSTKTSIREFFTRRSQSGPAGTPSTSSTPPLTQQQQLQQLQHQQVPSAAAMQPAPLSTTSPSAPRSKLPSPVTSPVSRAMDVNDQYKIPSHLLPESPPHIPTPASSNIPPLSTSPTATTTHHHRLSLLHPLLHLSELSHHHGSHQGSIAGSQYTPSSSSLMLAPQKEETEEPPLSMEDTKRIALRQDLIRLAFDGWFKSPLGPDQDRKVLHIGCGDGAWCLAASKAYPNWYFYGVDDSTGGPFMASAVRYRNSVINAGGLEDLTTLPINAHGNFQFIRASSTLLEGLEWIPDGYFDLVYGQCLLMSMPRRDYEAMVSHAWRVCKPGGFVELTELDLTLYGQLPLGRLTRWLNHRVTTATKKRRLDIKRAQHLQDLFFKLLVQDQTSRQRQQSYQVGYISLPLGVWGGRIGVMCRDELHDVLDDLRVATAPISSDDAPLTDQEWDVMSNNLDDEFEAQKSFMNLYRIHAKRH